MQAVRRSADLRRIAALPRRDWREYADIWIKQIHMALAKGDGDMQLRPVQAAMIIDAYENRGLFAPVGVGHGKTLPTLLIPVLLEAERPLLLVPAQLRDQTNLVVIPEMRKHWWLHPNLRVAGYSELSIASKADFLEELQPDLIIADECHKLKRRKAARTRRFLRYFSKFPETIFVGLSGTITKRSIMDYWHLLRLALKGDRCPLPLSWGACVDWDDALAPRAEDSDYERKLAPGALLDFCEPGEHVRNGFRRRLVQTPGVVATEESALGNSLIIQARKPKLPAAIQKALDNMERSWRTPGGEEISCAMDMARHAKELAAGFYYRWVWPGGVVNQPWLRARAEWHRYVRDILRRRFHGIDSPLQVAEESGRGRIDPGPYNAWKAVRDRYTPVTEPVWLSNYLTEMVGDWAYEEPGIVWVFHDAVGEALDSEYLTYHGGGQAAGRKVLELDGSKSVALSANAHSTGKNLQAYSRNLLTSCPSSALMWEQLLGRTHRTGQLADQVDVDVYLNTPRLEAALDKALEEARYIEDTTGQQQKLLMARIVRA